MKMQSKWSIWLFVPFDMKPSISETIDNKIVGNKNIIKVILKRSLCKKWPLIRKTIDNEMAGNKNIIKVVLKRSLCQDIMIILFYKAL